MVNVEGNRSSDSTRRDSGYPKLSEDELGNLFPLPEPQMPFPCTFQPGTPWERLITVQKTRVIIFIKL